MPASHRHTRRRHREIDRPDNLGSCGIRDIDHLEGARPPLGKESEVPRHGNCLTPSGRLDPTDDPGHLRIFDVHYLESRFRVGDVGMMTSHGDIRSRAGVHAPEDHRGLGIRDVDDLEPRIPIGHTGQGAGYCDTSSQSRRVDIPEWPWMRGVGDVDHSQTHMPVGNERHTARHSHPLSPTRRVAARNDRRGNRVGDIDDVKPCAVDGYVGLRRTCRHPADAVRQIGAPQDHRGVGLVTSMTVMEPKSCS